VHSLAQAYDGLAKQEIKPLAEMSVDSVRTLIDDAVADALRLPDLSEIRGMLAREPSITLIPS